MQRIVGKTLRKNVTDENNRSWNLSTTQRKIAFPLRTHARTNAPEYLARFVAAEICGQRIRPARAEGAWSAHSSPAKKKETEGASACRRSLSRWRIATRKATSRPRRGGGMLGVAFLTRFCFISGRHKLPTSSASHSFISTYFLLLFSICLCQRVQSRRRMELELVTGTGPGRAWHSAWVAHYLMMLFAIFSHLSAWFLLVEFFTEVSVSCSAFCNVFFACFQCHRTFGYFLFGQNFSSCGWANKDFEIW